MNKKDERLYITNLIEEASEMTIHIGGGPEAESFAEALKMIVLQRYFNLIPD